MRKQISFFALDIYASAQLHKLYSCVHSHPHQATSSLVFYEQLAASAKIAQNAAKFPFLTYSVFKGMRLFCSLLYEFLWCTFDFSRRMFLWTKELLILPQSILIKFI